MTELAITCSVILSPMCTDDAGSVHDYPPFIDEVDGAEHKINVLADRVTELEDENDDLRRELDVLKYADNKNDNEDEGVSDSGINNRNSNDSSDVDSVNNGNTGDVGVNTTDGGQTETLSASSLSMEATAYTAYCATGCTGVTSTGIDVSNTVYHDGGRIIATDPSVIPTGSTVRVRYGNTSFVAVAADVGGDIQGNRIDILVGSKDEALAFGRQDVEVTIIE